MRMDWNNPKKKRVFMMAKKYKQPELNIDWRKATPLIIGIVIAIASILLIAKWLG